MSISIDSAGRVVTGRTNVIIPPENAGVGDVILCKSGADPHALDANRKPANLLVVGWGTYDASNLPSGYVPYGAIYGFVNGMARVCALTEAARRWTMAASDTGSEASSGASGTEVNGGYRVEGSTVGGGKNRMRNGQPATTYVGMNLDSLMQNSYQGENTILHPTAAWTATAVMSKGNFEALSAGGGNAKDIYGTWENYVRQVMAIRNPGSCFMAHDSTHKVHEQGKWNTYLLGQYTASNSDSNTSGSAACWYPAANYCFNYAVSGTGESASSHNWWLPSMDELYDLMIDAHWRKVSTCGATTLGNRVNRWSSIRYYATNAWHYGGYGFANDGTVRYAFYARPVTLLQLT